MRTPPQIGPRPWRRRAFTVVVVLASTLAAASCGQEERLLVFGAGGEDAGASPGSFGTPDAASLEAGDDAGPSLALCASAECPAPYATCPSSSGTLPRYKCSTNLASDRDNCGECGNSCAVQAPSSVRLECVEGQCTALCPLDRLNCNGVIDDGCETNPLTDPKHCGGCGLACAPGVACIDGTCGCPPGKVACNGSCVDLASDDAHCGACGVDCTSNQPDAASPPDNMFYGCGNGTCNTLKCRGSWANCNGDLSDGCEVNLAARDASGFNDPNNCGGCGVVCAPGKKCFEIFGTGTVKCQCPAGETVCGAGSCADLQSDPNNCGSCGYRCGGIPPYGQGMRATCDRGRCALACDDGRSDCNGNIEDGCEADLLRDPRNCGGCGISCDVAAGQPCVNGACVTEECEGGVTK